jgi:uncharacterized phage protein (TIGR02218 family)
MPRTITANMRGHLAGDLISLVMCWKIKRRDLVVKAFTQHDEAIAWDGDTYTPLGGGTPSEFRQSNNLGVDNLDLEAVFTAGGITAEKLRAGLYDHAQWWTFLINWQDPAGCGIIRLGCGVLGEKEIGDHLGKVEMRSLTQMLATPVGEILTPECGASLGDSRCKVNMAPYTHAATVTARTSDRIFTCAALAGIGLDNYFAYGRVAFATGSNAGLTMQVKSSVNATGLITLEEPMPYAVAVNDTLTAYAGCDRRRESCVSPALGGRFDNILNFRGAPDLPGQDSILVIPSNLAWTSW